MASAWRLDCGMFDANSADPERRQARLQIAKPRCAHDDTHGKRRAEWFSAGKCALDSRLHGRLKTLDDSRDPLSTALHRCQRGLVNVTGAQRIDQHGRRFDGVDRLDRERSFVKS